MRISLQSLFRLDARPNTRKSQYRRRGRRLRRYGLSLHHMPSSAATRERTRRYGRGRPLRDRETYSATRRASGKERLDRSVKGTVPSWRRADFTRADGLPDARGGLAACRLDGDASRCIARRGTTGRSLALDHEILDVERIADHAEAVELERHLLVHGATGGEADHHGHVGRDDVEEPRQLARGHGHQIRGDDDQRYWCLQEQPEAVAEGAGHAHGDSLFDALQADSVGQRTIPIDHQHACHEVPLYGV